MAFSKSYELKELIELVNNHPEVALTEYEVQKAQTLIERINGEIRPKLNVLAGLGPNMSSRGNAISSTGSNSIDTVTYLADIKIQIPIFGFNRDKNLLDAASGNIQVKKIDVEQKKAELVKQIKEFYYGYQFASSLNEFAKGTLEDLDNALEDLKNSKKKSNDDYDKLSIFRSMAQTKLFEIQKGLSQATLGLKFITQDESPTIEQDWIEYTPREIPSIKEILDNLESTHFDLRKVNYGIDATYNMLESEKKSRLPVFGLFGQLDLRETPKSENQHSHFSYDPYNRSEISVGLGFIWEMDFGVKSSAIASALIEHESMKLKQNYAKRNFPLKLEAVYLELIEARSKVEELEKAYKTSKKIVTRIGTGIAMGLTPAKEIIDSYSMKAQTYYELHQAIYNFEMKLSQLSYEAGVEVDSLLTKSTNN